jgi:2Fe-2S ferredoxin
VPAVTYVHPDGRRETIEAAAGTTVMQAAVANGVDGIIGLCGGSAMCATCHVYVDVTFLPALPEVSPSEDEMLSYTASPREPNSRLGCQLHLTAALDGLVVALPELQE